jgi:hypothetical protein
VHAQGEAEDSTLCVCWVNIYTENVCLSSITGRRSER